jgi:hypothetical protein
MIGKMIAYQTHAPLRAKATAIKGHNARRLLTTMLQSVQAKRGNGCGFIMAKNAKYAAFLMQTVGV